MWSAIAMEANTWRMWNRARLCTWNRTTCGRLARLGVIMLVIALISLLKSGVRRRTVPSARWKALTP